MKAYEDHYQGARFYKCDLQMHTPADAAHWLGHPMGLSKDDRSSAAEEYIRRCYQIGLEVIGVTDHNFASKDFILLLRDAIERLKAQHLYEMVLLPGFEVQGPIGKGAHLLCVFDPASSLDAVDARLTQLGLPPNKRFDTGGQPLPVPTASMTFERMLEIVQQDRNLSGICVGSHPNNDGILDSNTVEQWWSQEVIKNEGFLCLELPRPRAEYVERPGDSLIKSVLLNADTRYKRRQSIATVCSSDCKRLTSDGGNACTNYIGFRHTWIKMSRPSIEALRQAFLDHDSRIRFGDRRPEDAYTYPKIRSLSVSGAGFLDDCGLALSPNLTALIGGRGTGKSTIIEYLRVALAQDASVQGEDARKNFEKLRKSINQGTVLSPRLEKDGQILVVESHGGKPPTVTEGPGAPDLTRFFPTRVLSQREIYAIAEDRTARLQLVDDLVRTRLDELGRREQDLVSEIRNLNQQTLRLPELQQRSRQLETETKDLESKLGRLKALEEPLRRWKGRLAEERFFADLPAEVARLAESVREAADAVELRATTVGDELANVPDANLVGRIAAAADRLAERFKVDVQAIARQFEDDARQLLQDPDVETWRAHIESERAEFEKVRVELQGQGTDPDQYLEYQRNLRERTIQLVELAKRISGIDALRIKRDGEEKSEQPRRRGLIDDLYDVWTAQTESRKQAARMLRDGVSRTSTGEPFVNVTVVAFGSGPAFLEYLRSTIRDHRRMSDDDWKQVMGAVFQAAHVRTPPVSPTAELADWVRALRRRKIPANFPWDLDDRRLQVLLEWLPDDRLEELRLWRTPDRVTIELYRQDGSRVGDLDGPLSVGQRCTAILALLLASGETPIVIDQPEEDLDNEFVFRELVPLMRKVKERRQLIVATHNANIPVNADAELVVALEVRDGRGRIMRAHGEEANGGLDRVPVKQAVEDIMEGSEEAFRRRFEKYGF